MAEERLQNIIAHAGYASRRKSSDLIEAGHVTVDGLIVNRPCERFDPEKVQIRIDGKPLPLGERKRTVVLYKPVGVLSSMSDPFGGKTAAEFVRAAPERLVPVGRLDKDSEGLLLMSNDGDLALKLTHPRYDHEKTYVVEVAGHWSEEKLRVLRSPVKMPDGYVILDCEAQNAYGAGGVNRNATISAPEFPALETGETAVSWTGSITGVSVIPRWWTL